MLHRQRSTKVNDIYMQEKVYQVHLRKMNNIQNTLSSNKKKMKQCVEQVRRLYSLDRGKKQVQQRIQQNIRQQNCRLIAQLLKTSLRKHQPYDDPKSTEKHFNSYFSNKKMQRRIRTQNCSLLQRMAESSSDVPRNDQLRKSFEKNRKLLKMVRKHPTILKHQNRFRQKLQTIKIDDMNKSSEITIKKSARPRQLLQI